MVRKTGAMSSSVFSTIKAQLSFKDEDLNIQHRQHITVKIV